MKRRTHRKLTSPKNKNITCNSCSKICLLAYHFKQQFTKNPQYKAAQTFHCTSCQYIGHNERSLVTNNQNKESCKYFEKQKEVTTYLLSNTSTLCIFQNNISLILSQFTIKWYSTDGIVYNVQINLKDDTRVKRQNEKKTIRWKVVIL